MIYSLLSHPIKRPIYTFLNECNKSPLKKEILDCGAGGPNPPLYVFFKSGYKTHGIDISDSALDKAHNFCKEHNIDLDIVKGDMRQIEFKDQSMSFVYSINTITHLTKRDTAIAMKEMERVLKVDGLCLVNFRSMDDPQIQARQDVDNGELIHMVHGKKNVHSFYGETEADPYFENFKIIYKEKRSTALPLEGWQIADIIYIAQKK